MYAMQQFAHTVHTESEHSVCRVPVYMRTSTCITNPVVKIIYTQFIFYSVVCSYVWNTYNTIHAYIQHLCSSFNSLPRATGKIHYKVKASHRGWIIVLYIAGKTVEVGYKQFVLAPLPYGNKTNPVLRKKFISASVSTKSPTFSCDVVLLACDQK